MHIFIYMNMNMGIAASYVFGELQVCIYMHLCIYKSVYINRNVHLNVYFYLRICLYKCKYMFMPYEYGNSGILCTWRITGVYLYVYMYVYTSYIQICIHTNIHTEYIHLWVCNGIYLFKYEYGDGFILCIHIYICIYIYI
jgi:hypothetical protein